MEKKGGTIYDLGFYNLPKFVHLGSHSKTVIYLDSRRTIPQIHNLSETSRPTSVTVNPRLNPKKKHRTIFQIC